MLDIYNAWPAAVTSVFMAFCLSIVVTVLMRFFAAIMVYGLIFAVVVLFSILTIYCWVIYTEFSDELDRKPDAEISAADEALSFT